MTAREKTRVMLVMGMIHNILDDVRQIAKDKKLLDQTNKIEKWSYKCINSLEIKKFSAGATRDIDKASAQINGLYQDLAKVGPADSVLQRLIAVDGMVCWIRTKHSLSSQSWRYLAQTTETMMNAFTKAFPDKQSVDFYLKADEVIAI